MSLPNITSVASTTMTTASPTTGPVSHFSVGQLLGTILLGAVDALTAYTNPAEIPVAIQSFTQGIMSIWFPTTTTQSSLPPTTGTNVAPIVTTSSPSIKTY